MKSCITILASLALLAAAGCEYEVAQPQWEKDHVNPPEPVIASIDPEAAVAGVNYIAVRGENFSTDPAGNKVYFDNIEAEIIESSGTAVTVRRPNLFSQSATIKLVSYDALIVARYSPYVVTRVHEVFGNFIEGNTLSSLTVDADGNLYVLELSSSASRNVMQVKPDGDKAQVGVLGTVNMSDCAISPTGQMVVLFNNTELHQVNINADIDSAVLWTEVTKRVKFGDFDQYGNFYTGAKTTDLIVVNHEDLSSKQLGLYARDDIQCVRVFNGHVYLLVELRSGEPALAIWRHAILDAEGNIGDRELVLDWSQTGEYVSSSPLSFALDENGNLYVGTDNNHPILVQYNNGDTDIFYKSILPSPITKIAWGAGNMLYAIVGGSTRTVIRVDMGARGASR